MASPESSRGAGRESAPGLWIRVVPAIALALTGLFTGTFLVAPICYWQGRQMSRGSSFIPLAYSRAAAGWHGLAFALGWIWVALWLVFAMGLFRRRASLAWAAPSAIIFVGCAWYATTVAYACNPF